MPCPRCSSLTVTKDGTTQLGGQRFRCSHCGRRFTRRSTSAFSGRAFPDDIVALAVLWCLSFRLSYAEVSEWLVERGVLVDQGTIYRWGATLPSPVCRGRSKVSPPCGSRLESRRDLRSHPRPLALHLSSHRRTRPDRGRV